MFILGHSALSATNSSFNNLISKLLQPLWLSSVLLCRHISSLFFGTESELVSDRKASVYVIPFKLEADGAAIFFTICPVFALNWNANSDGSIFHVRPGATLRGSLILLLLIFTPCTRLIVD